MEYRGWLLTRPKGMRKREWRKHLWKLAESGEMIHFHNWGTAECAIIRIPEDEYAYGPVKPNHTPEIKQV